MAKSGYIYESGEAISVGSHGDHSYTFAGDQPVSDTGGNSYVYETGTALGAATTIEVWYSHGQGDKNRSQCKTALPSTEPSVQWSTSLPTHDWDPEDAVSNLVLDDTYVYGITGEANPFRIKRSDGTLDWSIDADDSLGYPNSNCFLNRKHGLFVTHDMDLLIAWHTDGSGQAWKWITPDSPTTGADLSPYYMNGTEDYIAAHCGTGDSTEGDTLYLLNASDGTVEWYDADEGNASAFGPPGFAPENGDLYWGSTRCMERVIADGTETGAGSTPVGQVVHGHWTIDDPYVYGHGGNGSGELLKYDMSDMSRVWSTEWSGFASNVGPAINSAGDTLYCAGDYGEVGALDSDGNVLWSGSVGGDTYVPPALGANENVVVVGDSSWLYGLDTDNGGTLWTWGDDSGEGLATRQAVAFGDGGIYVSGPTNGDISFIK